MDLNKRLKLAGDLAADDVGTTLEKWDIHQVAAWAERWLTELFVLMPEEDMMRQIRERAPYLLEEGGDQPST